MTAFGTQSMPKAVIFLSARALIFDISHGGESIKDLSSGDSWHAVHAKSCHLLVSQSLDKVRVLARVQEGVKNTLFPQKIYFLERRLPELESNILLESCLLANDIRTSSCEILIPEVGELASALLHVHGEPLLGEQGSDGRGTGHPSLVGPCLCRHTNVQLVVWRALHLGW